MQGTWTWTFGACFFQDRSCSWAESRTPGTKERNRPPTPRLPTHITVFICGLTGRPLTLQEGQYFLYMSVNKIFKQATPPLPNWGCFPNLKRRKKKKTKGELTSLRTLYSHGPSQCKIETLFMEILTKRPLSTEQFSLNSTLGLFTSLQCIQNTLLVAASSQTRTIWQILVPV